MASVNVDAELVRRGGMLQKEEKMIELQNGCICCTLREVRVRGRVRVRVRIRVGVRVGVGVGG